MSAYKLDKDGLTITDFGAVFDGFKLVSNDFEIVSDEFSHQRRSVNVYEMVIRHSGGRLFRAEYYSDELNGCQWDLYGGDDPPAWEEVRAVETVTMTYVLMGAP